MKVMGLIRMMVLPLNLASARKAALSSVNVAPNSRAISSTTLKPMLWRVSSYSLPGFPNPTTKNFMTYQFGQPPHLSP